MSDAFDYIAAVLAELPDSFVINEPTLTPVIPPEKHGIVYYAPTLAPVATLDGGKRREITWNVAVISPITGMQAAGPPLFDALWAVIDVLEKSQTVRWTSATMEPYNDTLWCYSVQVTMYAENTEEG